MSDADVRRWPRATSRTWSSRAASKPVVPTTTWMPVRRCTSAGCPSPTSGRVKSTTTVAPASTSSSTVVAVVDDGRPARGRRRASTARHDLACPSGRARPARRPDRHCHVPRRSSRMTVRCRRKVDTPPTVETPRVVICTALQATRERSRSSSNGPITAATVGARAAPRPPADLVEGHRVDPGRGARRRSSSSP